MSFLKSKYFFITPVLTLSRRTVYKKGLKTDCRNCRDMSFLPTTYKILSDILLSMLTTYAEKTFAGHQGGIRRNSSTNDHILCIRQILEENGNTKKQSISSLETLTVCLTERYSRVRVGKNLSDTIPTRTGLKKGDALSLLLFNFA